MPTERGGRLPQVGGVSPAQRHAQQTALERIRRLSHAGLDVAGFFNEVSPINCQLVPNGIVLEVVRCS